VGGARLVSVLVALALLAGAPSAFARDPGRWVLTGATALPVDYYQGLTSDPAHRRIFFTGVFEGLWRTTPRLLQTAGVAAAIPAGVKATEAYNHIGDPTWNAADGGRVLLPFECTWGTPTCATGSFGVADPDTLALRYYVKLDPAEIPKAMWAESSPDGSLVWTSSGDDLLAYRSRDVVAANAGPGAAPIHSAVRLAAAVPPSGVTGGTFYRGRLLLAGESDGTYQVWGVNPRTGGRRLEIELRICGESEGLDVISTVGGRLHWLIAPYDIDCRLTFGPGGALLHFAPRPGRRQLSVRVLARRAGAIPGRLRATLRVTRRGNPVEHARVSFAGARARTDDHGRATVQTTLARPGRFRALARAGRGFGLSAFARVGDVGGGR
jgi:hypothetical protein